MHRYYDHIAHLRVEIYPQLPDRPTDMVHIWKYVQSICSDLQEASCVQRLSLHFMEYEYAAWSYFAQHLETFESLPLMWIQYAGWLLGGGLTRFQWEAGIQVENLGTFYIWPFFSIVASSRWFFRFI